MPAILVAKSEMSDKPSLNQLSNLSMNDRGLQGAVHLSACPHARRLLTIPLCNELSTRVQGGAE